MQDRIVLVEGVTLFGEVLLFVPWLVPAPFCKVAVCSALLVAILLSYCRHCEMHTVISAQA